MRLAELMLLAAMAAGATEVLAADADRGRLVYETNCGGCHYQKVHERKTTGIKTYGALKSEIAKWAPQANRSLTQADLDDIAEYLDRSHYRLAK